jgi:beta-lactamase regulating signal transducer with metallopeptidase domain
MNGFDGLMSTLGSPAVWDVAWLWAFKSAAILSVALLLGRLLGRATAALRYRVWAIAFGLVLVLPLADVALPGLPVLPDVRPVWSATGVDRPAVGTSASWTGDERSSRSDAAPANASEAGTAGVERVSAIDVAEVGPGPESGTVAMHEVPAAGTPSVDLGGTASTTAPAGTSETAVETVSGRSLVAAIWLFGLLAWLGALGVGLRRAQRLFRSGWSPREDIESEAMQIAGQLGLRRPVPVRIGAVDVPATWGWRRPRILLPADAEQWSRERLRRVLVHELAHIKRRDWPLTLVAEMARAVHWYNPLAWAGLSRMRVERERACDDMVLGTGVRPSDYATDLLEVARGATGPFASAPVMALGRGHRLSDRIEDLLDARRRRVERPHSPWVSGGILALIFGSLAVMTGAAGGVRECPGCRPGGRRPGGPGDSIIPVAPGG